MQRQSPPPARRSALTTELDRVVALVERDYEITNGAATGAQSAVVASRSVGFTLVAALLGVGLAQGSWPLLVLAALSGAAVYLIDAYYTWRANERDLYLRQLEDVLAARFSVLMRAPNNAREVARLARRLAALRIGATSQTRVFRRRNLRYLQPRPLFLFLYPLLLAFAIGAAGFFVVRGNDSGETAKADGYETGCCLPKPSE